jgi:type III restriction enzyme
MTDQFFEKPILNSPYAYPSQHWELDEEGQPTNRTISRRRRAEFITPIPKPKKRRQNQGIQKELVLYGNDGVSTFGTGSALFAWLGAAEIFAGFCGAD